MFKLLSSELKLEMNRKICTVWYYGRYRAAIAGSNEPEDWNLPKPAKVTLDCLDDQMIKLIQTSCGRAWDLGVGKTPCTCMWRTSHAAISSEKKIEEYEPRRTVESLWPNPGSWLVSKDVLSSTLELDSYQPCSYLASSFTSSAYALYLFNYTRTRYVLVCTIPKLCNWRYRSTQITYLGGGLILEVDKVCSPVWLHISVLISTAGLTICRTR